MRISILVASAAASAFFSSCNTTDISSARLPYESGQFNAAADEISKIHPQDAEGASTKNADRDNIWLLIEKGKMLMDAGRFEESNVAFYEANRILESLDEKALVSLGAVSSGTASLLLDDCQSDYIGSSYDRILLPAYVAVNHLMLGEPEAAAIAARQQGTWQARAAEARAKEIERIKELDEKAEEEGLGFDHDGAVAAMDARFEQRNEDDEDSPSPNEVVAKVTASAASIAKPALNDYCIPFGQVVGSMALAANGNIGEANAMLESLRRRIPSCAPLKAPPMRARTAYVVFENGLAPKRTDETVRFVYLYKAEVDVLDKNGKPTGQKKEVVVPSLVVLPFVGLEQGVAWTQAEDGDAELTPNSAASTLQIGAGGATTSTTLLHDMNGVVGLEFKEALPGIVARIIFRAAIQEVAQIAANNEYGTLAVLVGAIAKSTIDPDLRGWESLGANHQFTTVTVPTDGVLTFGTVGDDGVVATQEITVPVGPPIFVYARSTNAENLVVHSCQLLSN
jgi:hypothetical protein